MQECAAECSDWIIETSDETMLFLVTFQTLVVLLTTFSSSFFLIPVSAGPIHEEYHRRQQLSQSETLLFIAPECSMTGQWCVRGCHRMPDGDFQWCGGCTVYVRCRSSQMQLIACPQLPQPSFWDDQLGACTDSSQTCRCHGNNEEKTTEVATETSTDTPTEKPTETPTEKSTETPTEKPTETPTEKPTETPTEKPTEAPTEKTTEAPTEKPTETPTEKSTETPTEKPTEAPTEKPTEAPTEKPTETPTEKPTETPTEKPTETPTEKPTETPTEKPTEKPTETSTSPSETATAHTTPVTTPYTTTSTTESTTTNTTVPTPQSTTQHTTPISNETTTTPTSNVTTTLHTTPASNVTTTPASNVTTTPTSNVTTTLHTTPSSNVTTTLHTTPASNVTTTPTSNVTTTLHTTPTSNVTTTPTSNVTTTLHTTPTSNETTTPHTTPTSNVTTALHTTPASNVTTAPTSNETTTQHTIKPTTPFMTTTTPSPTTIETTTSGPTTTINPKDRDRYREGTVYINPGNEEVTYVLDKMDRERGAAYGFYNHTIHATGWGVLEIRTQPNHTPPLGPHGSNDTAKRMYAAGFLEGLLTARQIWNEYVNVRSFFLTPGDNETEEKVKKFFSEQHEWAKEMVTVYARRGDPYWTNVGYILEQLEGLHRGYRIVAKTEGWETDIFVVQLLNAMGDLLDLMQAVKDRSDRFQPMTNMTKQQINDYIARNSRCSALIKMTPGFENIFIGHSTWFIYASSLRMYKHYHFDYLDRLTASHRSSFSSYPGALVSIDDFYLLDSGLVMIQTTNNIFNTSLYDLVTTESLFAWQRVLLANRLANNGRRWFQVFKEFNSGTYNNQYMIIDLSKIKPNEEVQDGALWVVEQIPGHVVGDDQTNILRAGHWPSYNVPFYEEIYNRSGYPTIVQLYGLHYSYQLSPRAKIFRREAGRVTNNITSFQELLRYNAYKTDEYSDGSPSETICSRGDLENADPSAFGCTDTKVTDYKMALQLSSLALNGPTTSHALPVFSWIGSFENVSHVGLPNRYDFDWIDMTPTLLK